MRLGREKILIYGQAKSGKTRSALTFARGSAQHKYILLETDDGAEKVIAEMGIPVGEVTKDSLSPESRGVSLFRPIPKDWNEYNACIDRIKKWVSEKKLGPNDWVHTEGLDIVLDEMRGEFSERTTSIERNSTAWDNYIVKRIKGAPILEPSDYDAIYSEFRKALNFLALQMPCNWIVTTGVEEIQKNGKYADSQDEQDFYLSLGMGGVKPSGYKQIPRKVDTLILLTKNPASGYQFKIYGDRGANVRGQDSSSGTVPTWRKNTDLFQDYLVKMVGWQELSPVSSNGMIPPPVGV